MTSKLFSARNSFTATNLSSTYNRGCRGDSPALSPKFNIPILYVQTLSSALSQLLYSTGNNNLYLYVIVSVKSVEMGTEALIDARSVIPVQPEGVVNAALFDPKSVSPVLVLPAKKYTLIDAFEIFAEFEAKILAHKKTFLFSVIGISDADGVFIEPEKVYDLFGYGVSAVNDTLKLPLFSVIRLSPG